MARTFKLLTIDQLDEVMEIINDAIELLSHLSLQWQQGYPNAEVMARDLKNNWVYGLYDGDALVVISSLVPGFNPDYAVIEKGNWTYPTGDNDATIHRIAVKAGYHGKKYGIDMVKFMIEESRRRGYKSLKADTHITNIAMQQLCLKNGFEFKGIIYIQRDEEDNSRLAYEIVL